MTTIKTIALIIDTKQFIDHPVYVVRVWTLQGFQHIKMNREDTKMNAFDELQKQFPDAILAATREQFAELQNNMVEAALQEA